MIKVIDNFIIKQDQLFIQNHLLENFGTFPWFYNKSTELDFHISLSKNELDTPQMTHQFKEIGVDGVIETFKFILPVLARINQPLVNYDRIKTNLCFNISNNTIKKHQLIHKDWDEDDRYSMLYYVNDSDGDTLFFDNKKKKIIKRVAPKMGRLVIFDAMIPHAGCNPINNNERCVINLVIKKDYINQLI